MKKRASKLLVKCQVTSVVNNSSTGAHPTRLSLARGCKNAGKIGFNLYDACVLVFWFAKHIQDLERNVLLIIHQTGQINW